MTLGRVLEPPGVGRSSSVGDCFGSTRHTGREALPHLDSGAHGARPKTVARAFGFVIGDSVLYHSPRGLASGERFCVTFALGSGEKLSATLGIANLLVSLRNRHLKSQDHERR